MGLLLSVLITCVGVLEVIACYTHFRIGTAYNECKSNIRDIAKYYAVELRKHELHFEPGPDDGGPSTSQETLSELIRKRTVRTQEKSQNGHIASLDVSEQGTPKLKVPRNSISGLDSPTVQKLMSPTVDITEAIAEKIQSLDNNDWIRKSPSPYPERSGLEVVDKDFWRSRSPSPFPESKDSDSGVELIYTPGLKKTRDVSPLLETPDIPGNLQRSPSGSELVDKDYWNKTRILTPEPLDDSAAYSKADLEVQNITESIMKSEIVRQPSPYPEVLFGITADSAETDETKYDEAFLRSLDGVKSSKCDDRRRSFKKKRNSSSTSSRASRDEISRSLTSLDDIDMIESKKYTPLTEEDTNEVNGHEIRTENVRLEKCESIASEKNKEEATITKQEQTLFEAKVSDNTSQESSKPDKGKPNISFTEKVKDLEISVQLLVTVKGTSQGDKMEYTTTVSQDDQKPNTQKSLDHSEDIKEEITKTTEDKSEFGNVKTSVTYGSSKLPEDSTKDNLKDLQISSQSLIHAERTVQDDVASSEAEFLKLYETFTELPDKEKDKFLQKIGQKSVEETTSNSNTEINLENPPQEVVPPPENVAPKQPNEEKILITEITEITESTESVITIPPETPVNKKGVSPAKEYKQNEINESIVIGKQANNSENIVEKQMVPEPSKIENTEVICQQIITQTNEVNSDISAKQITEFVNTETQIEEPKITTKENIIVDNINKETKTNDNQISGSVIEETKTVTTKKVKQLETTPIEENKSTIVEETITTQVNAESKVSSIIGEHTQVPDNLSKIVEENTVTTIEQLKTAPIEEINSTVVEKTITPHVNDESKKSSIIEEPKQVSNNLSNVVEEKTIATIEKQLQTSPIEESKSTVVEKTITPHVNDESKKSSIIEEPTQVPSNISNVVEEKTITTLEKQLETIPIVEETITTITKESTTSQANEEPKQSSEIESQKPKTTPDVAKAESSSDSSSTPSTVVENPLRRASKTAFEDATPVQNQEMTRRVSSSEISPKQASQAFWLIFSAEYTNAMEKDWHGQHFSCWQCDESLTGQRYVLRDDHPYCVKCYEQVFANPCEKCSRIIGIDSKDLSYKDKHWHEACFQCTTCNESLVDKQFGAKGEKIYCGNCYDKQFASRCDGCGKIFHAGTKKMEYKNRQWHEQCFKCCKCETPIGTKSFIPREKDIYCAGCYEEKFATRCVKCDKAIQSGGVTYKNEPWHRECFTCTHCNNNLAGKRFTSRDDKPCCAECFGRLFAKRCTSCAEPITGIGGTRFISFEDRHWHNDCFICAACSTSLVGRGFITDEDKIICPECAKERFM